MAGLHPEPIDGVPLLTYLLRRGRDMFDRSEQKIDASLSILLAVQAFTIFVVIPCGTRSASGRVLLDLCHLAFAAVSVTVLARHRIVQGALILGMMLLAGWPLLDVQFPVVASWLGPAGLFEAVSGVAFAFNALVTAVVARHVFRTGRVTGHRVQGAVLLYLNVAALFAIAYSAIDTFAPGAIAPSNGGGLPSGIPAHTAALTYFSLTTITTTGFGDVVPVNAAARSLANLESVFGHLFPATLLARLVALHIAHGDETDLDATKVDHEQWRPDRPILRNGQDSRTRTDVGLTDGNG